MKAEEFYKQRSNSIRELWALSPKQIEYIALIMEEYVALRQPLVSGMLKCAPWTLTSLLTYRQPPVIGSVCDGCGSKFDAMDISVGVCYCCQKEIKQTDL